MFREYEKKTNIKNNEVPGIGKLANKILNSGNY